VLTLKPRATLAAGDDYASVKRLIFVTKKAQQG
jgi:hypothetical protein